jgi:beta-glucosidase/6-phospho-beta-glucosidase/beta-galactosidase
LAFITGLLDNGVEAIFAAYHFDLTQSFEDRSGSSNPATTGAFMEYAAVLTTQVIKAKTAIPATLAFWKVT